ncbi:suppressor of glycerol defect [Tulasnella sp. 419]|nr:suppressor of glycerol defect [Tulasnella sp. 419]
MAHRRNSTTNLPKSLWEEIKGQRVESSGFDDQGRPKRTLSSRKASRKLKRQEAKTRRTEYFAHRPSNTEIVVPENPKKRSAPPLPPDSLVNKRPRLEAPKSALKISGAKPGRKVTFDVDVTTDDRPPKSDASQPTKVQRARSKTSKLEAAVMTNIAGGRKRSQVEDAEDAEIAWLEAKLGIGNSGKRNTKLFEEDGLDELLQSLDHIVPTTYHIPSRDESETEEESDSEESSETEASEESQYTDFDEESEFTGIEADDPTSLNQNDEDHSHREETTTDSVRYIPPQLRHKTSSEPATEQTEEQKKLTRKVQGLLNKLSEQNIGTILTEFEGVYRHHGRNYVTTTITALIIDGIASHSALLDSFVILHAALVSSFHKVVGIEFAAYFVQTLVSTYDSYYQLATAESPTTAEDSSIDEPTSTKGKETSNLLILISELYRFQVISYLLIYDIIRTLLDSNLSELDVELLLKLLKNSGPQLRHDDPNALKDIVSIVEGKIGADIKSQSSRTRFMLETLIDLKSNKVANKRSSNQSTELTTASAERMKKFLSGLGKRQTTKSQEPLNVSLADLRSADKRGKWWLVGAAWAGDPLAERKANKEDQNQQSQPMEQSQELDITASLEKLARKQGMNSDIRRNIFVALMTSDDYVDACQKLGQLSLSEIQQRDIIRVILHCCGNEKTYNPFYTLIVQRLCELSHSHKITLQYCLWDLFRELGETSVGGEELVKGLKADSFGTKNVPRTRASNLARAYAWWIAKGAITLSVLKPLDFISLQPQTTEFLSIFFSQLLVSSQTASPMLDVRRASDSEAHKLARDKEVLEILAMKISRHMALAQGIIHFLINSNIEQVAGSEEIAKFIQWAIHIMIDTLRMGTDVALALD